MESLKEFMLFRYVPANEGSSAESEQKMHCKWNDFIGNIAQQKKLAGTYQLGMEGTVIGPDLSTTEGVKLMNHEIIGGNMIIKAESWEDAILPGKKCPVLHIGGSVEIRDLLPIH